MQDCIGRLDMAESLSSQDLSAGSQNVGLKNSDTLFRICSQLEKRQDALENRQAETEIRERMLCEQSRQGLELGDSCLLEPGGLEALAQRQAEVERLWQEELSARRIAEVEQRSLVQAVASVQEDIKG